MPSTKRTARGKKVGRPTLYTKALADTICRRISMGESLIRICRDEGMPDYSTVRRWLWEDDKRGFQAAYAKARAEQTEYWAEELLDIADDGTNDWVKNADPDNPGYRFNGEHFQRSRLRLDTRKWLHSKLAARKFGDRITVDTNINEGLSKEQLLDEAQRLGLTKEQLFGG